MTKKNHIKKAAKIIQDGGLVAFPTETVYGLGANALNPDAVIKIFEAKQRPSFDPLIVHICDIEDIDRLCLNVDERVYKLAKRFWPGPLTIILPKKDIVPDIVTSGLSTVAIRMPAHDVALQLIDKAGCPIAAPSANKFGKLSPTKAEHVMKQLSDVDLIIDGGKTTVGIESTVISLSPAGFKILRPGVITEEEIEFIIPRDNSIKINDGSLVSPGLLKSHYSPIKPLSIFKDGDYYPESKKIGYLAFQKSNLTLHYSTVEILSEKGDLKEAAVNLFGALHRLEDSEVDMIVADPVPEVGVGVAIMDRLRKASYTKNEKY